MSNVVERQIPFANGFTWARITEPTNPAETALPLIVLHGGPGFCHNYLRPLEELADLTGRTIIHYDQYGCGNSTHEPDASADFWTPALFVEEFENLVTSLSINSAHILGQSWGGMLAAELGVRKLQVIKSLMICNSPASMQLWSRAADELRSHLPSEIQDTLAKYEAAEDYDNSEYVEAAEYYDSQHVIRIPGGHPAYEESKRQVEKDPTVYHIMNGPNEFHVVGTLKNWSIIDRLPQISAPALVLAGEFDEAQPIVWRPFVERIPKVESVVIEGASHASHLEKPDQFNEIVSRFMSDHDLS